MRYYILGSHRTRAQISLDSYPLFAPSLVIAEAPPSEIRKPLLSFQFEVFKVLRPVIFEDFGVECIIKTRVTLLAVNAAFWKAMCFGLTMMAGLHIENAVLRWPNGLMA
jgi:hypothetical protein